MKTTRRAAGLLSGLIAACTLALAGATPASAATWTLVHHPGHEQRICLPPERSMPNTYFLAAVKGTWDTKITTGVRNLPPGSYSNGGAIHPSEWNERYNGFTGYVHVSIAAAPAGDYIAELWADDGTDVQTAPVVISFSDNCYGD